MSLHSVKPAAVAAPRPGAMIGAFCTIGEAAYQVDVAPHVLRFWESRISHIRPLKRGRWRYYRASDIELLRRVRRLLHEEGYTIHGVQRLLDSEAGQEPPLPSADAARAPVRGVSEQRRQEIESTLDALRDTLAVLRQRLDAA